MITNNITGTNGLYLLYGTGLCILCIFLGKRQNMFSYTPCQDTAISPWDGISLSSTTPLPSVALAPMSSYPTQLFFMTTTTKKVRSINYPKLPLYLELEMCPQDTDAPTSDFLPQKVRAIMIIQDNLHIQDKHL